MSLLHLTNGVKIRYRGESLEDAVRRRAEQRELPKRWKDSRRRRGIVSAWRHGVKPPRRGKVRGHGKSWRNPGRW